MVLSHSSSAMRMAASQSIGDWLKWASAEARTNWLRSRRRPRSRNSQPVPRHVFLGEARQGGDEAHDVVESGEQRIEVAACLEEFVARAVQQRADGSVHVGRETVAQR